MANNPEIDLVTLETVHRLLADTEFASAQDLAASGGAAAVGAVLESRRSSTAVSVDTDGQASLPKRR